MLIYGVSRRRCAGTTRSWSSCWRFADMNLHIAQINAIAEQQMSEVSTEIARSVTLLLGATPAGQRGDWSERLPDIDNKDRVQAISDDMHKRAAAALGHAWGTYERLKVEAAGRRLADEVASASSTHRDRAVRASCARDRSMARMQPEWKDTPRLQELFGAG